MSVLGIILHVVCQIRRFVLHLNLSSRGISGLDAGGGQWGAVGMSGGQYGKSPITGGDKLPNSMRNGDLSGRLSTDGGVVRLVGIEGRAGGVSGSGAWVMGRPAASTTRMSQVFMASVWPLDQNQAK